MTDSGCLNLSLAHPEAAFLYNGTKPRVRLDGAELPVAGWGRHQLPVPAGPHRLQIWVPYALPRKAGRAALDIVVPAGGTLDLEYMAPMFTMARGSLGTRLDERMLCVINLRYMGGQVGPQDWQRATLLICAIRQLPPAPSHRQTGPVRRLTPALGASINYGVASADQGLLGLIDALSCAGRARSAVAACYVGPRRSCGRLASRRLDGGGGNSDGCEDGVAGIRRR